MKVIFLGSQGSGKSTQAKLLAGVLNLPYVEMGQLLRDRANQNDDVAQKIKSALDKGNLVTDEITISILQEKIAQLEFQNGYILDGYPRNYVQLEASDEDIDKVFYIKISDGEAIKRLSLRKREDDTKYVLAKRLTIYHQQIEPLLADFRKRRVLEEIDGERSIEETHRDVLKKINK